jgi:hypothetical protein
MGADQHNPPYCLVPTTLAGAHRDVYRELEEELLKRTGWRTIAGSSAWMQKFFEKYLLDRLRRKPLRLNFPVGDKRRALFAVLSGREHVKIFQHYLGRARLKAVYQFDTWPFENALNENAFRSFGVNIAFISIRDAARHFDSLGIPGFRAHWIPEAVATDRFRAEAYRDRTVDVLQYGRIWEWMHERIMRFSGSRPIVYRFPPGAGNTKSQFAARQDLVDALARSKVVICAPKATTHGNEYSLQTVTTRYFECFASKCLVLGHAPPDLVELFGYNPVIEVNHDNAEGQLGEILGAYDDYIPLIEKNYETVRSKHQWRHRIDDMIAIMDKALSSPSPD